MNPKHMMCLIGFLGAFALAQEIFIIPKLRAQTPNTLAVSLQIDPTPAIPLPWTRQIPQPEPYGAEATWVCLKTEGNPELAGGVSVYAISHPSFGYAVRPGKWYWRKMDDDLRQKMISGSVQIPLTPVWTASEVSELKARITKAVQILEAK